MSSYNAVRQGAVMPFCCSVNSVGSAANSCTAVVKEAKANISREVVSDNIMTTLMVQNRQEELLGLWLDYSSRCM
jgi:hypothetical protein